MEEREVCRKRGEQAEYKEPSVTQTIASKPRLAFNPLFLTRKSALSSETLSADNNSFYSKAGGGGYQMCVRRTKSYYLGTHWQKQVHLRIYFSLFLKM